MRLFPAAALHEFVPCSCSQPALPAGNSSARFFQKESQTKTTNMTSAPDLPGRSLNVPGRFCMCVMSVRDGGGGGGVGGKRR